MPSLLALGSPTTSLSPSEVHQAVTRVLGSLGPRSRVLVVPPDHTRSNSRAGPITRSIHDHYGAALTDILPALGTHAPMSAEQLSRMYPGVPLHLFRVHDWRHDVETIATIPAATVATVTEGIWDRPWPVQLNRLIWSGGHDLIISVGQVVPHEVAGMANHAKNLFIGAGGAEGLNQSHFIGAAFGMERMMGQTDTPVRRLLDLAMARCARLPILFILTVVGPDGHGDLVTRGLFIGSDRECLEQAAALSMQVNFTLVDRPLTTVVVRLPEDEFHSTWLGNKAIYRTRLAIADGGHLIVLAPGVRGFGEDPVIDALIRAHGYRTSPEILAAIRAHPELQANLSAAAHLIHGSSEGRFRITYCPGHLSRTEIEGVGYGFGDLAAMSVRYPASPATTGWQMTTDGEPYYAIDNPALGLWAEAGRLALARAPRPPMG